MEGKADISIQDVPSNVGKYPGVRLARTNTDICHPGQENKWEAHELYAYIFKSYKSSFKLLNKIAFILYLDK